MCVLHTDMSYFYDMKKGVCQHVEFVNTKYMSVDKKKKMTNTEDSVSVVSVVANKVAPFTTAMVSDKWVFDIFTLAITHIIIHITRINLTFFFSHHFYNHLFLIF